MNNSLFTCPVCGYHELSEAAFDELGCASFEICPCCGTQFGYDDSSLEHSRLRAQWMNGGLKWWSSSTNQPQNWDAIAQLKRAGYKGIQ